MKPDLSKKLSKKIETLCELGCTQVNQIIEDTNKGNTVDDLADFSTAEVNLIIDELSQIMAIYTADEDSDNNENNIK